MDMDGSWGHDKSFQDGLSTRWSGLDSFFGGEYTDKEIRFQHTYEMSLREALPEEDARGSDDVVQQSAVLDQRIQRLFKLSDYLPFPIGHFRWAGSRWHWPRPIGQSITLRRTLMVGPDIS